MWIFTGFLLQSHSLNPKLVHVEFEVDGIVLVQLFSHVSYHFTDAPYTSVVRGLYSRKMITLKTD